MNRLWTTFIYIVLAIEINVISCPLPSSMYSKTFLSSWPTCCAICTSMISPIHGWISLAQGRFSQQKSITCWHWILHTCLMFHLNAISIMIHIYFIHFFFIIFILSNLAIITTVIAVTWFGAFSIIAFKHTLTILIS